MKLWRRRPLDRARAAIIIALLAVGACTDEAGNAEKRLAEGKKLLADGDFSSAVLELRSAVQADINNYEARFALAQAYLNTGNASGALKEFRRARELGLAGEDLDLGLTRAMILSGKVDKAAIEIGISGKPDQIEWLVLQALLDHALGRYDAARNIYLEVLDRDPKHVEAHRGLLQTELAMGNRELARTEIRRALEVTQDDFAIWMLKGQLDISDRQFEEARSSYEKALLLSSGNPAARLGLAMAILSLGRAAEATETLDALAPNAQQDPRVQYLRALIAQQRGEREAALQHLRKVLQTTPNHIESLLATAQLNLELGDYSAAEQHLVQILSIAPGHAAAKRMLGAVHLAAGRLDEVLGSVSDLDVEALENPQMLALLGAAFLKHGRYDEGEKSLSRAHELSPDSAPIRTQLALSKLGTGKIEEALSDLAEIRKAAPDFTQAYLLSVATYLRSGDGKQALKVAEAFLAQHPDTAIALNLLGFAQQSVGQREQARKNYAGALVVDEGFHPAQLNLARMDIQAGNDDQARLRLERVLEKTPYYPDALLGLASLAIKNNDFAEAERLWAEAREHNPNLAAPRLLLANYYLNGKKLSLARNMVSEAYDIAPYSPAAQMLYARIMLASGDAAVAVPVLERLSERMPTSTGILQLKADAYNKVGNKEAFEKTLVLILEKQPDHLVANTALAKLKARRGEFAEAYGVADKLIADQQSGAAGYLLKGDILMMEDKPGEALSAYTHAHERAPTSQTVLMLYGAEKRTRGTSDRLTAWLEQNPDDQAIRIAHAMELQSAGRKANAIKEYERLLEQGANNPGVLNNLAWLYHERGDEGALELARRAYESAPELPQIMDTYGWILVKQGQSERGLDLLRRALDRAPDSGDIRYHLAAALARTDAKEAASKELEALLGDQATFASKPAAQALLKELLDQQ